MSERELPAGEGELLLVGFTEIELEALCGWAAGDIGLPECGVENCPICSARAKCRAALDLTSRLPGDVPWQAEAKRLRAEGLTYREIGERCGKALSTVHTLLTSDPVAENTRKRAWERDHRVPCAACGGPTGRTPGQQANRGRPVGEKLCRDCDTAKQAARTAERGHRIEQWWAEGMTLGQIAGRLGWSKGHLSSEMNRLRKKGFNLTPRGLGGGQA